MNLFTGMTNRQILSAALMFLLFNFFVVLEVSALAAFYVSTRPRRGRVRTAPILYAIAAMWFVMCFISTVWAAPAEKSFLDADNPPGDALFQGARFQKVLIGLVFAAIGIGFMLAGVVIGGRQKRVAAQRALLEGA